MLLLMWAMPMYIELHKNSILGTQLETNTMTIQVLLQFQHENLTPITIRKLIKLNYFLIVDMTGFRSGCYVFVLIM